mmetsp:Transcript_19196/g.28573  ORF Transcript_19196/g.28573 Transcript_19196/m.28573 type:complete len:205 (-) Transcript_19196:833-1447(-)
MQKILLILINVGILNNLLITITIKTNALGNNNILSTRRGGLVILQVLCLCKLVEKVQLVQIMCNLLLCLSMLNVMVHFNLPLNIDFMVLVIHYQICQLKITKYSPLNKHLPISLGLSLGHVKNTMYQKRVKLLFLDVLIQVLYQLGFVSNIQRLLLAQYPIRHQFLRCSTFSNIWMLSTNLSHTFQVNNAMLVFPKQPLNLLNF